MKESTGGALLMGFAAGIIVIFIIMVAFFISYGKTFRVKNDLINRIEQYEGMTASEIRTYISNTGKITTYTAKEVRACRNIVKVSGITKGFTIKVIVYMEMGRNILGSLFNVRIPVKGETRIIEKGKYMDNLSLLTLKDCPANDDSKDYEIILDI